MAWRKKMSKQIKPSRNTIPCHQKVQEQTSEISRVTMTPTRLFRAQASPPHLCRAPPGKRPRRTRAARRGLNGLSKGTNKDHIQRHPVPRIASTLPSIHIRIAVGRHCSHKHSATLARCCRAARPTFLSSSASSTKRMILKTKMQ